MSETKIMYKLLLLKLLNRVDFSLSNSQICEFFVKYGYADYFNVQKYIHELSESELITDNQTHNITYFSISEKGKDTLTHMSDHITPAMSLDIDNYLSENGVSLEDENTVTADYYPASYGGYNIHAKVIRDKNTIIDLTLHVGSQEQAKAITLNWKRDYENVYASLMDILTK